jgi:hypothetical protein
MFNGGALNRKSNKKYKNKTPKKVAYLPLY